MNIEEQNELDQLMTEQNTAIKEVEKAIDKVHAIEAMIELVLSQCGERPQPSS